MADLKITELDPLTAPVVADLLAIVDDVSGTPITKRITLADLNQIFVDLTDAQTIAGAKTWSDAATFSAAITALSYGGILEADLLDLSASETITGAYQFDGSLSMNSQLALISGSTLRALNPANSAWVDFDVDATPDLTIASTSVTDLNITGFSSIIFGDLSYVTSTTTLAIDVAGRISLNESNTVPAPATNFGTIWVDNTTTPSQLVFTDDTPTDWPLARVTGTPVDNQLAIWTASNTLEGDVKLTYDGDSIDITVDNVNPAIQIHGNTGAAATPYIHLFNLGLNVDHRVLHVKEVAVGGFFIDADYSGSGTNNAIVFGQDVGAGVTPLINMIFDGTLEFADSLWVMDTPNNRMDFNTGAALRLIGSGGVNLVSLSHDNTDLNIAGTTTTDINITGITAIAAGTVDADFDAITGTSYGAILEANLLDKSATETITGAYTFQTASGIGIEDSGGTDSVTFDHDGTDFNTTFSNTADWNIAGGLTNLRLTATTSLFLQDGCTLRIFDSTDTDSGIFSHDGTDFNTVFITTTDWNISGITAIQAGTVDADFDVITATAYGGPFAHTGTTVGFYNTTAAAQSAAYTRTATVVESRTLAASASASTTNNNNVLAALIADLQAIGLLA